MAELLLYGFLSLLASKKAAKTVREALGIWYLFPVFHLTYGAGSMAGIFSLIRRKRKNDDDRDSGKRIKKAS